MTPASSTQALRTRRCVRHPAREAAARCAGCGGFFCRECISEHEHRVYCSPCLVRVTTTSTAQKTGYMRLLASRLRGTLSVGAALLVLWSGFYYLGRMLVRIPHEFHDGKIWADLTDNDHEGGEP